MAHFSIDELRNLGISLPNNPKNIQISKKTSLYNPHLMAFGDNIRIDDFCILSGKIIIADFIHISAFVALYGGSNKGGIEINSFSTISPKATIFATNDDFSGEFLISPMVHKIFCNVKEAKVLLNTHTQICSNATILPGVVCGKGTVLGAMSLLKNSTEEFSIYAGIPAQKIKNRSKNILKLEQEFQRFLSRNNDMGGGIAKNEA
ncbi:hypothetical protein CCY99_09165 [Helicobacter sp. 16-1353]|uniref:acyltransferase n=1 Tax=Helicobacter sp. 16-1353 TaxID=2004996 RepID=UPI000DCF60E5|nr:acyltransferase [Helicobacter sp. 16-1353]RAX51438.1 hypothetical protein CCY99_09165 [Helicobacter sp. 16-1353]